MTTLLYDYYLASIRDAKKNLQGEELEKCLQALDNYMKNFGERVICGGADGRTEE